MGTHVFKGNLPDDDPRYGTASVTVGRTLSLSGRARPTVKTGKPDGQATEVSAQASQAPPASTPPNPPASSGYSPEMTRQQKTAFVSRIDVNRRTEGGQTPLHMAVELNDGVLIELLAKAGADLEALNDVQATPLFIAVCNKECLKAAKALVKAGAEVNSPNESGASPLHYAALAGLKPSVKVLIAAGADVAALDNEGRFPSDYAMMGGFLPLAEFLQQVQTLGQL